MNTSFLARPPGVPAATGQSVVISMGILIMAIFPCGKGQVAGRDKVESADSSNQVVEAARAQVGVTVIYDPSYVALKYPGGDVSSERGVCTDVVIRALRTARGMDLQKLVHEDMKANFSKYPRIWGLKRADRNIDHRRVPNLRTFFKRQGFSLPVTRTVKDYEPGDLVTCTVPPGLPHIMIVSSRKNSTGVPLIIHNIGRGTREEDALFAYPLTGHYRLK